MRLATFTLFGFIMICPVCAFPQTTLWDVAPINKGLFKKNIEVVDFFDYLIESKSFDSEQKNLLIYKKSIFMLDFILENELLNQLNPIINTDSVWKVNSLILIADYFFHQKNYLKSKEFYEKIFSLKDSTSEQINYAKSQLNKI